MARAELVPGVGIMEQAQLADGVWPEGVILNCEGDLIVGDVSMTKMAAAFGTPTYVIDEAAFRHGCRQYRGALPDVEISYASKALLTRAIACWVRQEGLSLDVCSAGELAVARTVGFPSSRITLHGNAKTPEDLKAAIGHQVGRIVIDSVDEIDQVAALAPDRQQVLLRVAPGLGGHTYPAIAAGAEDEKFGFSLINGSATEAVRRVLARPGLNLVGLHCHIGSQIARVAGFGEAVRRMVDLMAAFRDEYGLALGLLELGGGHAVRYRPGDEEFDLAGFARHVTAAVKDECDRHGLPVPRLAIGPGPSLVARAGITLYRIVTVKRLASGHTFVAVDGGISDNPRSALYGARYTAQLIGRAPTGPLGEATVVGRRCESGDGLATDVALPTDIHAGDLLAVPWTGAYHHPLASNYHLVGRPPLVAVEGGDARLLIRRETEEDLQARDVGL
jgi:diaminopimelate decarboxylase